MAPSQRRKVRGVEGMRQWFWQTLKSPLPPPPVSHLHPFSPPPVNTLVVSIPRCCAVCLCRWASPSVQTHTHTSHGLPHPRAHCCPAAPLLWGRPAEAPELVRHTPGSSGGWCVGLPGKLCPPLAGLCPCGSPPERQSPLEGLAFLPTLCSAGDSTVVRETPLQWKPYPGTKGCLRQSGSPRKEWGAHGA